MTKKIVKKVTTTKKKEDFGLKKNMTKSAMIRHLHAAGKSRSEIVKIISEFQGKAIIYQHVRNVLITPLKRNEARKNK